MTFDDMKTFEGKVYTGMTIGGTHTWDYPHGVWQEQKVAPDRWLCSFRSEKKRARKAPEGSGALPGTEYHGFILAHQRVRKVEQDTCETIMQGVKYKIAHKRPYWRRWSNDYPDNEPEREILIRILQEYPVDLKEEDIRCRERLHHLIPEEKKSGVLVNHGHSFLNACDHLWCDTHPLLRLTNPLTNPLYNPIEESVSGESQDLML